MLKYIELVIDLWFLIEIGLNFISGYIFQGQQVLLKKKIALHYLKTWFGPDIVSSIPFSLCYFVDTSFFDEY